MMRSKVVYDYVGRSNAAPFIHTPQDGGILVINHGPGEFTEWFVFALGDEWSCVHLEIGVDATGAHIDRCTTYQNVHASSVKVFGDIKGDCWPPRSWTPFRRY